MSKRLPLATELELMLREQHKIGYAAGFRAGQEAMRERAISVCQSADLEAIRALPIVEPDAEK